MNDNDDNVFFKSGLSELEGLFKRPELDLGQDLRSNGGQKLHVPPAQHTHVHHLLPTEKNEERASEVDQAGRSRNPDEKERGRGLCPICRRPDCRLSTTGSGRLF